MGFVDNSAVFLFLSIIHVAVFTKSSSEAKHLLKKNRIYLWSPMQTEKSQPEGKRIMPETRFTKFPALSIDQRVGISLSASEIDV